MGWDRRAGAREKRGGTREKRAREAGEIEKNFATIRNILQYKHSMKIGIYVKLKLVKSCVMLDSQLYTRFKCV